MWYGLISWERAICLTEADSCLMGTMAPTINGKEKNIISKSFFQQQEISWQGSESCMKVSIWMTKQFTMHVRGKLIISHRRRFPHRIIFWRGLANSGLSYYPAPGRMYGKKVTPFCSTEILVLNAHSILKFILFYFIYALLSLRERFFCFSHRRNGSLRGVFE